MFGYVTIQKPELKIRDFTRYQGYYCGLCRSLRKRHGVTGQLTLNYDMVFLAALLTGLYEGKEEAALRGMSFSAFVRTCMIEELAKKGA